MLNQRFPFLKFLIIYCFRVREFSTKSLPPAIRWVWRFLEAIVKAGDKGFVRNVSTLQTAIGSDLSLIPLIKKCLQVRLSTDNLASLIKRYQKAKLLSDNLVTSLA